ncbi:MAG: DUF1926 domain-containing protein [Proteobacteria bacterium]|nr:DUF1926 domain-containing protein [Pseudomonadota bacterium]
MKNFNLIENRLKLLVQELLPLDEKVEKISNKDENKKKLAEAKAYYQDALELFNKVKTEKNLSSNDARKRIFSDIIKAQVEIDFINNPDVDPTNGWVRHQFIDIDDDGAQELMIDTQLQTLFFNPRLSGAVVEYDYKPRKANLVNTFSEKQLDLSLVEAIIPKVLVPASNEPALILLNRISAQAASLSECHINRHAPDLISVRFNKTLVNDKNAEFKLYKDVIVKSGIGAYLNNATTGFSWEYWIEGENKPEEEDIFLNQVSFMLPSFSLDGISLRPLSTFGGVSDSAFELARGKAFEYKEVEGGLYGVRIIDGIANFVIDVRSAKAINKCLVFPLVVNSVFYGVTIHFYVEAKRIFEDTKANTIFFSIM